MYLKPTGYFWKQVTSVSASFFRDRAHCSFVAWPLIFITFYRNGHEFIFPKYWAFGYVMFFPHILHWGGTTLLTGVAVESPGLSSVLYSAIALWFRGVLLGCPAPFFSWTFFFSPAGHFCSALQPNKECALKKKNKTKWSNDFKILSTASWTGSWKVHRTVNKSISILRPARRAEEKFHNN